MRWREVNTAANGNNKLRTLETDAHGSGLAWLRTHARGRSCRHKSTPRRSTTRIRPERAKMSVDPVVPSFLARGSPLLSLSVAAEATADFADHSSSVRSSLQQLHVQFASSASVATATTTLDHDSVSIDSPLSRLRTRSPLPDRRIVQAVRRDMPTSVSRIGQFATSVTRESADSPSGSLATSPAASSSSTSASTAAAAASAAKRTNRHTTATAAIQGAEHEEQANIMRVREDTHSHAHHCRRAIVAGCDHRVECWLALNSALLCLLCPLFLLLSLSRAHRTV